MNKNKIDSMNLNVLNIIRHWFLLMATVVWAFTGCSDEALVETHAPKQVLQLRFPQMEQVVTRVNDNYHDWCSAYRDECILYSCDLLFFDWNGDYLDYFSGMDPYYSYISPNDEFPCGGIELNALIPEDCRTIVVAGNLNILPYELYGRNLSDLTEFFDRSDCWSYFSSGYGLPGYGLPVLGKVNRDNWEWEGVSLFCNMYFSVAKIQLLINEYYVYNTEWTMYNVPESGNAGFDLGSWLDRLPGPCYPVKHTPVYRNYDIETSAKKTTAYIDYYPYQEQHPEDRDYYFYVPEHQNSVVAKGQTVDKNAFHKDRTCIILKVNSGSDGTPRYYRIDFLTGNGKDETKQFFDLLRNRHYVVKVTHIYSEGYGTIDEALNNPSSNIEYSIEGISEETTISNGQYAIDFTRQFDVLYYYGDDVEDKEVVIGYIKAVYPQASNDFAISTNEISLVNSGLTELVEPRQQITGELMPIKVKLKKPATGGYPESFQLQLKLGNIEQIFEYHVNFEGAIPATGSSSLLNDISGSSPTITVEDGGPDSFIQFDSNANTYNLNVPENTTTAPVYQETTVNVFQGYRYQTKVKYMITQRAKE